MAQILNKQDVKAILYGACLMGAGGGGALESGMALLESVSQVRDISVKMISLDEMEPNTYAGVVAGLGSPIKLKERGANFKVEPIAAFEALQKVAFFMNRKLNAVFPVEYGAANTFIPMIVSMELGIPFVDADGSGRAVPALETLLFGVNNVPIAPLVMTNSKGDVMINYPVDSYDAAGMENIARYVCQAFDMLMGIAGWMSTREQIEELLVPGGYSKALKVGYAILNAIENKLDVSEEISKVIEYRELWRGKLTKLEAVAERGFDFGRTYFEGIGKYDGKKFRVDYQNENLVAYEGDKPLITVPESICFLNLDNGQPMSNADVAEGMNVLVCAIPAEKNWDRSSRGEECWKPYFETVGFKGECIRY